MRRFGSRSLIGTELCETSPMRKVDPRAKLLMSITLASAVMLPLDRLAICFGIYLVFIAWAKLFKRFLDHLYQLKWVLILLFIVDWLVVNLQLAGEVTLRLILLTSVFTMLLSTTSPGELGLAFEKSRIPYRYAFSINLAFQSLGLLQEEWNAIWEAQTSRGVLPKITSFRSLFQKIGDLVALTVPALVLTTRRAWSITESAHSRGFDSPHRIPYNQLCMKSVDWIVMISPAALILLLYLWR